MTLVGISGKIGSGKSTLAEILHNEYGYSSKIFAGKLKTIAALLLNMPEEWMYSRDMKDIFIANWGMSIGEFQQRLGTDAIRTGLHTDAWVLALFADFTGDEDWSVSDVRFPNEADMITNMGGIMVRIDGSRTGPGNRDPNHISETALDDYEFDYRFTNDGTLEDLVEHARIIHRLAYKGV
jgi:hypothetical protein